MGLLDQITGALGQTGGAESDSQSGMLGTVMNLINQQEGGLQGLVSRFQSGGLGEVVNSWVSSGENLPVSAEQIQNVLGSEQINGVADQLGIDPSSAASGLAQFLPQIVDKLTPNGSVEDGNSLTSAALGMLKGKLFG